MKVSKFVLERLRRRDKAQYHSALWPPTNIVDVVGHSIITSPLFGQF